MLQQICEEIHNFFMSEPHCGRYQIADGMILLSFMKEGQRFRIVGSDLNDGVYTYHAAGIKDDDDSAVAGLQDETFAGTICALAVPPAVIALSGEVKAWVAENGEAIMSPFQSESVIGAYSYTMKSGSGATGSVSWKDQFKSRLDPYRRLFP